MNQLTEGIVSRVKDGSIRIKGFSGDLQIKDGAHVLIIGTKSGFLRIIPIETDQISHIRIVMTLDGFREAAKTIFNKIRKLKLVLVHSTGFCPREEDCVWEGYFSVEERDKIEEFFGWTNSLDPVITTDISYLSSK
jgi:hypothetical protein